MTFANCRLSGKNPVSIDLFTHLVNTSKINSHSLNILVGVSAPITLLVLRSRMIFLTLSTESVLTLLYLFEIKIGSTIYRKRFAISRVIKNGKFKLSFFIRVNKLITLFFKVTNINRLFSFISHIFKS